MNRKKTAELLLSFTDPFYDARGNLRKPAKKDISCLDTAGEKFNNVIGYSEIQLDHAEKPSSDEAIAFHDGDGEREVTLLLKRVTSGNCRGGGCRCRVDYCALNLASLLALARIGAKSLKE